MQENTPSKERQVALANEIILNSWSVNYQVTASFMNGFISGRVIVCSQPRPDRATLTTPPAK